MSTSSPLPVVELKSGHVRPVWAGHPWVFAQAIARVPQGLEAGDEVLVRDPRGNPLGRGLFEPDSAIRVRLYTRDPEQAIDRALLADRLERALQLRQGAELPSRGPELRTNGYRLLHGEGDGLPGLVVDAFGDVLVLQLGTAGLRRRRDDIVAVLRERVGPGAILDRSTGVADDQRWLQGKPRTELEFFERGMHYRLPVSLGQKTGFYFDQRPLRQRIEALSRGSRVLDAFSYVGGIGLAAARGGAREVLCVDKSAPALEVAAACAELTDLAGSVRQQRIDARKLLAEAAEQDGYDVVVCDPPKLAQARRGRKKALDAYTALARAACRATARGGVLAFCSCSGAVSLHELQRALAIGAREADRRAVVFDRCFQGEDHPTPAAFPEGLYLKVLLSRVEAA